MVKHDPSALLITRNVNINNEEYPMFFYYILLTSIGTWVELLTYRKLLTTSRFRKICIPNRKVCVPNRKICDPNRFQTSVVEGQRIGWPMISDNFNINAFDN